LMMYVCMDDACKVEEVDYRLIGVNGIGGFHKPKIGARTRATR
jgi:hypothetical protein